MVPEMKSNNRYELRNNNKSYKVDFIINIKLRNSFICRNFCHDEQLLYFSSFLSIFSVIFMNIMYIIDAVFILCV